jgi:hypothetical protein
VISWREYVTREGDTFDALALAAYNDEKLADRIMEFNPDYCCVIVFGAGTVLRIPVFAEDGERPDTLPPWRRDA